MTLDHWMAHRGTATPGDAHFVLYRVPWWTYVALRDALDQDGNVKMTYLRGTLELMRPSILHQEVKTIIARLIEAWAMVRDVDLRGFGGATFRKEAKERGLEPDECYTLGPIAEGGVPDIAVEVSVSNALVDKMDVYAGLGVPEVWNWESGALTVHRLVGETYQSVARSVVVPDLDIAHLVTFVRPGESQTRLAREYQKALGASP